MKIFNKKKKIFIMFFSIFLVIGLPITIGVSYVIITKNNKTKLNFLNNNSSSEIDINTSEFNQIKNKIFENNSEQFYYKNELEIPYIYLYNSVVFIRKQSKNFNFSKIMRILNDVDISSLFFYDLYYYLKLVKIFDIKINEELVNKRIQKNWDPQSNLFFLSTKHDPYGFKITITNVWLSYLREKNDRTYIPFIKNKIETIINSESLGDKNNAMSIFKFDKDLFESATFFKLSIDKNIDVISKFYLSLKNKAIEILENDILKVHYIIRLLKYTDFYFSNENKEIKEKLLEKINNLDDNNIKELIDDGIEFSAIINFLGEKNINSNVIDKFFEFSKQFVESKNIFRIRPDIKNTYYYLLTMNSLGEKINKNKIMNFLAKHNYYLDYEVAKNNTNKWVKEILFHEKISTLLNYKKTSLENKTLTDRLNEIIRRDLDYESVFYLFEIMKNNNLTYIDKNLAKKLKELTVSFNKWPHDDKKQITVFVYWIDKILSSNHLNENDLKDSADWIFKNTTKFNYFQKEIIYNFLLIIPTMSNGKAKEHIKNKLLENKEKVMQNIDNDDENFLFINGLLRSEYKKIESDKNDKN